VLSSVVTRDPPAKCSLEVQDAIHKAANAVVGSHGTMHMISRAYHDSLFMSQKVPTGMIFIPCAHGYSHRPDEFVSAEDMATGVHVLAGALLELATAGTADVGCPRDDL
jgi:ureidoglycolate amidohydrolase